MKILVAIASYGIKNDNYLSRLADEYRRMSFSVDLVVLSNVQKNVVPGAELVVVDLRGRDPWSLPFPHKQLFADRLNDYDLFIYSEDDTLVTEGNIRAFMEVSDALPQSEIPGFLRFEQSSGGARNFPEVHGHFHWDPSSVRRRGEFELAYFTNEHSACYALTRAQLERAIDSGGFLVAPHQGKYDLLCTAATDPYTQCGMQKLICISRIEEFLVHHLPDKYVGTTFGVNGHELHRQVDALLQNGQNGHRPTSLFETETRLMHAGYSKSYYEPVKPELYSLIPSGTRNVLSVGCGSGALEVRLVENGVRVVGVPLDPVIAGEAEAKGVEMVHGGFQAALEALSGVRFDCVVLSNVLHLVPNPPSLVASFRDLLSDDSLVLAVVPNTGRVATPRGKYGSHNGVRHFGNYEATGVHQTSHRIVRQWFRDADMRPQRIVDVLSPRARTVGHLTLGTVNSLLAREFLATASKA